MKFKLIHQLESNDCGPACLTMIALYYGKKINLKQAKALCSVTRMGVSVKDILDGARKIGFEAHGLKLSIDQLSEMPLPIILFWKHDHFVVLHNIKFKKNRTIYEIADPAYGIIKLESALFEQEWLGNNIKGVAIVLQEDTSTESFYQPQEKSVEKKTDLGLISQIAQFISINKLQYIISFALLLIALAANWLLPLVFKRVIDEGIIGRSLNLVGALLLAQFALFLGNFIAHLMSDLLLTRLNFKLSINLKEGFLKKMIRLPVNYFDTRLNTDTLQRLSDLSKVQTFLTWKGISLIINLLNLSVFSVMLFFLSKWVFLIFSTLSICSILWIGFFLKKRATLEYSMFIQKSENSNIIYEFIMNMPEIKVNRAENTLISKITRLQEKQNKLELKSLFLNMYQLLGANFILKLKEIITIAICAYLIMNNQMTIGNLLGISYILGQLSGPIMNFINNIHDGQDAIIANKRVNDVYEVKDENKNDKTPVNREAENILLENVSFKYPGSFNPFVLQNISIHIPKNKITAIVGTSGSGKTTLMKLLLAYYPPNSGTIFLGQKSFEEIDPDSWRDKCGVVLQEGHIFSGAISYNITLSTSEELDENRLNEAVRLACLENFIENLPMGLNTRIGSAGMQLSGGQKQRILIARAIYKNPSYIFLDEATSSLDANNERAIINNLKSFFKGRTVIIIAHRLSTVKDADEIIVLENGQIIEKGNHHHLVMKKDRYYALVKNQLELGQ
nr:peptidase domain-containing ABC transporter [uncultured Flavobacterium sp.]